EMGHNFGLGHCPDQACIMVDAEEKMKLDAQKGLCSNCKHKLPF
ncbi:MAG: Zn-dependent protease, partial [Chitinophagaceae bacterium]|nr:Zn-dependent protease [Chitinophagaceae bacterium]